MREESREYIVELACIIKNHFIPLKNTKAHSFQRPKNDYSDSHSKSFNFVA